ncbi:MAG: hypothetical protein L6W00_19090 [Lentisphaeria bacterium]|nr:MAG: hypothetical protein L6W00_19090 [Lentisphaeria bacterium]
MLKRNLIRLLFSGLAGQRPDSLIVLNENLLPIACDALAELGLTPGTDVMIASHSNYPFEKEPLPQVDYFCLSGARHSGKQFSAVDGPGAAFPPDSAAAARHFHHSKKEFLK